MEFQQFKIGFLILIFFKILISISNANEESYRISHAIIPEEKYLFNEPRSRVKRDSKLSAAEKKLALDTHNKLRANETAKNMREFVSFKSINKKSLILQIFLLNFIIRLKGLGSSNC